MSELAAETAAAVQEVAEETPLPAESRQSLDTLLERPVMNGASENELERVQKGQDGAEDVMEHDEGAPSEEHERTSRTAQLQAELERVTSERDNFQSQYRGLLGKLSNMRTTLGDKLRQDAVSRTESSSFYTRHGTDCIFTR